MIKNTLMNKILTFVSLLFVSLLALQSCTKDTVTEKFVIMSPVYMERAEVRQSIKSTAPVALAAPGKIYIQNNYVFLNEVNKGVHIIDMSNPASPKKVSFIKVPGCIDIAVNGNYLYADCNTDLATIDISNPQQVVLKSYLEKALPNKYYYNWVDTNRMIVDWVKKDTVVTRRADEVLDNKIWGGGVLLSATSSSGSGSQVAATPIGKAGSTARMTILNNRLYYVGSWEMIIHSLANPATPAKTNSFYFNMGSVETISQLKNNLFIGSMSGMMVYDATNPDAPVFKSSFSHARLCDPVIADGNYAYVTLRSGTACEGTENEMDILYVADIAKPVFLKKYNLTAPSGLSKDGNILFVCDGSSGLRIFNATEPNNPVLIKSMALAEQPNDIIAFSGKGIITASTGLYFIEYSSPTDATLKGSILLGN